MILKLWKVFVEEDATLVEVNPLARLDGDKLEALDGKVSLDDNAEVRHPDHEEFEIKEEADPLESKAKDKGLNYVKLDGQVGIIGNGAGLVMCTLDVVAYAGEAHGGVKPANFLDIGGGANAEVMANGLDVILHDEQVKACSSTSSAASPPVTRSPTASSARWRSSVTRRPSRSSYGSTATTSSRAARSSTDANHPLVTLVDTMDGAADKAAELAQRRRRTRNTEMHLPQQGLQDHRPGHHRRDGLQAHRADDRGGPTIVGGVNARKAGTTVAASGADVELPVFGTVKEAMAETGADVSVAVRAAGVHQGRLRRGDRRRDRR